MGGVEPDMTAQRDQVAKDALAEARILSALHILAVAQSPSTETNLRLQLRTC